MTELEKKFEEMLIAVRDATIDFKPDNSQKLKLYAFYKQVKEGDNNTKKPSALKMVERAKWMAWDAIKGMSKEDAMRGYLRVFGEEYLPAGESDNDSPSSTIASKLEPVESKSQRKAIDKIAVLGAGTMGAQIAAHFANAKFPVVLFDLKSQQGSANVIIEDSLAKLTKLNPAPFGSKDSIKYITPANYEDNLELLADCDLIIEAVAERIDIKESLYTKISSHIKENAILASNTSGLSITKLAQVLPENLKVNFCGVHFFNPPRYMPLVELIPHADTNSEILDKLETFLVEKLGKSIIRAKDTPNFIANRLGVFSMLVTCYYTEQMSIPLEVVDELTGKKLGRAKSATYRTADLVGLDVLSHVVETMKDNLEDGWQKLYNTPNWIQNLINNGSLGQKTKKGLYIKASDGIKVLDLGTNEYRPADKKADKEILDILAERDWSKKLEGLRNSDNHQAQFLWATFREMFLYAAHLVGDISNFPKDMDLAIRWGFGWKQGIFEIWQLAGWHKVASWLKDDISTGKALSTNTLPSWIDTLDISVYQNNKEFSYKDKELISRDSLDVYKRQLFADNIVEHTSTLATQTLYENDGVKLWQIDDYSNIGILSFKSKMCAIGDDVLDGISESINYAEEKLDGLVIWQEQDVFSVGANLEEFGIKFAMNGEAAIEEVIRKGHSIISKKLRYSKIPVVAAVKGFAFGGGCETILHSDAAVAAYESYIGLVEAAVGIIPGWGGSKEMAVRASQAQDHWKDFERRYKNLALAQVAKSAYEAKEMGFLRDDDIVVMNTKEILLVAIKKAQLMALAGYQPPLKQKVPVFGETGIATIKALLVNMRDGNQISEHDYKIAVNLADTMCGGQIEKDTEVSEDWLLERELINFKELAISEKTEARMKYMLETGKPLRN
ncbi:acyl-CoA-binding protein [Francisella tularensis]|uniref:Fusion product of 3-hydroxacyl-CoA dehydrogenase and acyl-CoA-binding protein n=4 Tax=Francisella tularensis TaxID=263 RepID=Q5NET2_FRATT|nr:acyl-CoA-binding protein [Francisella tularensis]ADA79178.1 fusion product of 3-hydroxacyl-CoA dehydrogenase and acyl-CoA-binding protein [Francisella tularensis subsp. tularensis NE061598]AFB79551.1 Enoyl-CoA hydratase [Francisella tularensis subsp. tularensis TIGB03]AFB81095.1 Enoyl-CoA hydratase [Francisella tularensis subsp. tularensis TI0902]AJI69941.1 enoyl-CoA hydratase/isomerase family protein [Francisella tularensis subsp. tularensis SCHU S4]AJI70278.1 enoyl-CoA hydratase/isomerase